MTICENNSIEDPCNHLHCDGCDAILEEEERTYKIEVGQVANMEWETIERVAYKCEDCYFRYYNFKVK